RPARPGPRLAPGQGGGAGEEGSDRPGGAVLQGSGAEDRAGQGAHRGVQARHGLPRSAWLPAAPHLRGRTMDSESGFAPAPEPVKPKLPPLAQELLREFELLARMRDEEDAPWIDPVLPALDQSLGLTVEAQATNLRDLMGLSYQGSAAPEAVKLFRQIAAGKKKIRLERLLRDHRDVSIRDG